MDYTQARQYIAAALQFGWKLGLERLRALMAALGDPQDRQRYIHIAGTNGKGSTAMYTACALARAGFRTGLFTSPYIERFTERIRVIRGAGGLERMAVDESEGEIGEADFAAVVTRVAAAVATLTAQGMEPPTEFELITAAAFLHFAAQACDYVVLEVGLGGIFDSTNVIARAEVCVITALGYDHMDRLGSTMAEIAGNKAGIIKPGSRTILYDPAVACDNPQDAAAVEAVVRARCDATGSPLTIIRAHQVETLRSDLDGQRFRLRLGAQSREYHTRLLGAHQPLNAAVAAAAVLPLCEPRAVVEGIAAARWPVRQEIVRRARPPVLIDGSHNPQSVRELVATLEQVFAGREIIFVCGVMADKDHAEMLRLVLTAERFRAAAFFAVTPDHPRALPAAALLAEARTVLAADRLEKSGAADYNDACMLVAVDDPVAAADEAFRVATERDGVLCVFGSLYMVGAVRSHLRRPDAPPEGEV